MDDALLFSLRAAVGFDAVVTDPAVLASAASDWTGRFPGRALAVVRPATANEVAAVLRACSAAGVAVVPQGGNTGLVGGAVPRDAIVLSTARLGEIGPVDALAREVTVGAGATLERLQDAARAAGLEFGVDLAARGSATIGGMIATDAGGVRALRHGSMRAQLVDIEAAVTDGTVVRDVPAELASPGVGLVDVLVGSEGTLAVVTQARVRLVPARTQRAVALVALDGIGEAVAVMEHLRSELPDLEAVELIDRASLELVAARDGVAPPFGGRGPVLLAEVAGDTPALDGLAAVLGALPIRDAVVADDGPGMRRLWALREGVSEAIAGAGVPHKLDVRLPPDRIPGFLDGLEPLLAAIEPGMRVFVFGHLGLGNLHVNVLGPAPDDERIDDAVLRRVADLGGSIAGEHGIGRAKAPWLPLAWSPAELALHAERKRALDPAGVLNPGVLDPSAAGPLREAAH